jgi:hypothetical protein
VNKAQKVARKAEGRLRLRIAIQTEAKMRLLYAEQAMIAAKNGFNDLYAEYTRLAAEAHERQEDLKARDAEMG